MDTDSPSTSDEATTILDLNDDCLYDVFKYLHLFELANVADVCSCFRRTAESFFAQSTFKTIDLWDNIYWCDSINQQILQTYKVLRNFGDLIIKIRKVSAYAKNSDDNLRSPYQLKTLEHLSRYCSGTLVELDLVDFVITDEITLIMRPLLENLKKLTFHDCQFSKLFLEMLPLWSSELRELKFDCIHPLEDEEQILRFAGLHQPFRELVKISFEYIDDLKNNTIEEMLKCNSQLKEIEILFCRNLDYHIFQSIGEHVPEIENMCIRLKRNARNARSPIAKYFGRLGDLHSLEIDYRLASSTHIIVSAICEIAATNIPLKQLRLRHLKLNRNANLFVDGISKLNKLERLQLACILGMDAYRISAICKNLSKLYELILEIDFIPTVENILEFAQNGEALNLLSISPFESATGKTKICIDVSIFMKLVKIVAKRCKRTHLEIELDDRFYVTNIPDHLAAAHKDSLTLSIENIGSKYD